LGHPHDDGGALLDGLGAGVPVQADLGEAERLSLLAVLGTQTLVG
jgi:hypothetical protein